MLGGEGLVLPVLAQLYVPLLRCRQTPQGSTLLPAVPTRTFPFLTSPQASVWLPCLATQVSVALILSPWNFPLSSFSFLGPSRTVCPSPLANSLCVGTDTWLGLQGGS